MFNFVVMLFSFLLLISSHILLAEELDMSSPLLTYGDQSMTLAEFDAYLQLAPGYGQEKLLKNESRLFQVIENMYLKRLLAQEAIDDGLLDNSLEKAKFNNAKVNYLSAARLRMLDEKITDSEVSVLAKEYYVAHPDEFLGDSYLHVSHIFIKHSKDQDMSALEYAKRVYKEISAGLDFESAAAQYSQDPTVNDNKGDLGVLPYSAFVPEFLKAALALKSPGDISDVVQSSIGFHIIKLNEKVPPKSDDWEVVKGNVMEKMRAQITKRKKDTYIEGLRTKKSYHLDKHILQQYLDSRLKAVGDEAE
jgi:peptidyl-prolyl cis-trans isomerase C